MNIEELKISININDNAKLKKAFNKMKRLIDELKTKEIPVEIVAKINSDIKNINSFISSEKELTKILRKTYCKTLTLIEDKLKLVPQNHYRNLWLSIGISVFGITFGTVFSVVFDNYGFIGMGIPFGMIIGMAVGINLDEKAFEEGKQLNISCNY